MMQRDNELPSPPYTGVVQAEDNVADPPTADVLWRKTGLLSTVPQPQLQKVFNSPLGARQVGQYAQIVGFPELEVEPGDQVEGLPPKSPAAAGPIVDAFVLAPYGTQQPPGGNGEVVIAAEEGRSFFVVEYTLLADDEASYMIQPGRRNV